MSKSEGEVSKTEEERGWFGELMDSPFSTMMRFMTDVLKETWVPAEENEVRKPGVIWRRFFTEKNRRKLEEKLKLAKEMRDILSRGASEASDILRFNEISENLKALEEKTKGVLAFLKAAGKLLVTLIGLPIAVVLGLLVGSVAFCIKKGFMDGVSDIKKGGWKNILKGLGKIIFIGIGGCGGIIAAIVFGVAPFVAGVTAAVTTLWGLSVAAVGAIQAGGGMALWAAATTFVTLVTTGVTLVAGVIGRPLEKAFYWFYNRAKNTLANAQKTIGSTLGIVSDSDLASEFSNKKQALQKLAESKQLRNELGQINTVMAKTLSAISEKVVTQIHDMTSKMNTSFKKTKDSVIFSGTKPLEAVVAASRLKSDLKLNKLSYVATLPVTATAQNVLRFIEKAQRNGVKIQAIRRGPGGPLCPLVISKEEKHAKERTLTLPDNWETKFFSKRENDQTKATKAKKAEKTQEPRRRPDSSPPVH